jgi:hypothetical protein
MTGPAIAVVNRSDVEVMVRFPVSDRTVLVTAMGRQMSLSSGRVEIVIDTSRANQRVPSGVLLNWDVSGRAEPVRAISRGIMGGETTVPSFDLTMRRRRLGVQYLSSGVSVACSSWRGQLLDLGSVDDVIAAAIVGMAMNGFQRRHTGWLGGMLHAALPTFGFDERLQRSSVVESLILARRRERLSPPFLG